MMSRSNCTHQLNPRKRYPYNVHANREIKYTSANRRFKISDTLHPHGRVSCSGLRGKYQQKLSTNTYPCSFGNTASDGTISFESISLSSKEEKRRLYSELKRAIGDASTSLPRSRATAGLPFIPVINSFTYLSVLCRYFAVLNLSSEDVAAH